MTRFAGKYGLYLYRELDVDISDEVTGTPVLFIPGHAGSYKQVRTIAAASAYQYYHHGDDRQNHQATGGSSNLDVFTVDFNEEFSALHGQSLLEQAEYINDAIDYILKLYPQARRQQQLHSDKLPDPTSIILVGHSMGGIVARTTFTLTNYQPGSIYTVITLSTPHLLPPAPFDWKISAIYDTIDSYWRHGYLPDLDYRSSLHEVMLVSIAGGTLDNTICSDSTNVGDLVPPTNGFTVFSTAIPHVWSAADHNEILACQPLDRILARALLDTIDTRRGSQAKPLVDRMAIMKKAFLSGLENHHGNSSDLTLGNWTFVSLDQCMVLNWTTYLSTKTIPGAPLTLLALDGTGGSGLTFLTDQNARYELLLCRKEQGMVGCRSVHAAVAVPVPASNENNIYAFSGNEFVFASLTSKETTGYDYVGVVDHHHQAGQGFFLVDAFSEEKNVQVINTSMLGIAWNGIQATVPSSLFSVLHIPSIENPMLAYHLKITGPTCPSSNLSPFLRQSITTMYESKFYVHLAAGKATDHYYQQVGDMTTHLSVHGRTAFSSMNINSQSNSDDDRGLIMQFWMDPQCHQPLVFDLSIDWYVTLGRIGFRNGMVLLTFSFLVVMLVFVGQLKCYNQSGVFPSFSEGLAYFYRRTFPWTLAVISFASIYQCHHSSITTPLAEENTTGWIVWTDILTGNSDSFFWWVPAFGWVISTGMISGISIVMDGFLRWCASAIMIYPWRTWTPDESRQQKIQRRIIATLILFCLVATVIPYQFVFVVTFLVHGVTCIRTLRRSRTKLPHRALDRKSSNRYHYMQTLLLLLLTLLPFNLPILLVWIRNVSVYWSTPFSSDHSVFAIAPFLIHVEMLTTQMKMMIPRHHYHHQQQQQEHEKEQQGSASGQWWLAWLTYGLMYIIIVYAFLYGVKYPHSIYFLSNYLILWLLFLHFCQSRYSHTLFRTLLHFFTSPHKHRRSS
ncbi:PGAP1-like protein-domain-containing protein [Absidia repens]|uniref:GPI inositol-deacylase n=1 Tax=Absidia repens TaxID=90262 RepID=A0A1X2IEP6_9FUNG|nr:PGAP1-like protein-domain-containing protein [Absidia repens]